MGTVVITDGPHHSFI